MNESLVKLAQERFLNMTQAETQMLETAINGTPAICGPNNDDGDSANDPSNSASWPPSRTIHADVLEWLCTTDVAAGRVSRQGIHIYAAKISGILKFAYTTIPFPLLFQRCVFTDDISFKNARIPSLILSGSWTRTGYGYKLWRAFVWIVLMTIIGIICSSMGYREKMIAPAEKGAYAYFEAHQQPPAYYQQFSSFMYSVEHSIPAINLGISSNWSVNTATQIPKHPCYVYGLRWWFCVQTLLGWGLSIFFIAGLTGLVKSDK